MWTALVVGVLVRLLIGLGALAVLAIPAVALVAVWTLVVQVRHGLHAHRTHHAG